MRLGRNFGYYDAQLRDVQKFIVHVQNVYLCTYATSVGGVFHGGLLTLEY